MPEEAENLGLAGIAVAPEAGAEALPPELQGIAPVFPLNSDLVTPDLVTEGAPPETLGEGHPSNNVVASSLDGALAEAALPESASGEPGLALAQRQGGEAGPPTPSNPHRAEEPSHLGASHLGVSGGGTPREGGGERMAPRYSQPDGDLEGRAATGRTEQTSSPAEQANGRTERASQEAKAAAPAEAATPTEAGTDRPGGAGEAERLARREANAVGEEPQPAREGALPAGDSPVKGEPKKGEEAPPATGTLINDPAPDSAGDPEPDKRLDPARPAAEAADLGSRDGENAAGDSAFGGETEDQPDQTAPAQSDEALFEDAAASLAKSDGVGALTGASAGASVASAARPSALALSAGPWADLIAQQLDRAAGSEAGWATLSVDLGEGEGSLTVRARQGDGRLVVAVQLSDPAVRAAAERQAAEIQARLEQHYETAVDLSFGRGEGGQEGGGDTSRGSSSAPTLPKPAEQTNPAPTSSPTHPSARQEWIG